MEEHNVYILDVDYEIDEKDGLPVVKIIGKTDRKKSVLVLHKEFLPYFYAYPDQAKVAKVREEIEKTDYKDGELKILKTEIVEKILNAEKLKLIKITTNSPHKIPETREKIKDLPNVLDTYEYDIPFYKRYLIDKDLRPLSWVKVKGEATSAENFKVDLVLEASSIRQAELEEEPHLKILAYDIEILEEKNKEVLIMISAAGNDGFKKVITTWHWDKKQDFVEVVKDEKALLERFIEIVKENDPDILVDYNGDGFDMPRLRARAEDLKVRLAIGRDNTPVIFVRRGRDNSAKVKGRVHIDLFVFIANQLRFMLKSETLGLDSVASELLGVGKKQLKFVEMQHIWKTKSDVEKLAEYSMWDSELTLKLAEHLMPQIFSVSRLTGLTPFDGSRAMYSRLVEGFYMKKAFEDNVVAPSRPHEEEREARRGVEKYKGAIVIEPKAGLHSNISVFDFRSLYPSVIVSHNISPETFGCPHKECKEKNSVPDTNYHFCTKVKGFISRHLEDVLKERQKVKVELKKHKRGSKEFIELDNLQGALKIIANATYGYFAYFGAKWYRRECGESAAAFGRYYITQVVDLAKKAGFDIIYGDSVTKDRFVTILDKNNFVRIKNIEELFEENRFNVKKIGEKEVIPLGDYKVLTKNPRTKENEWASINEIIRHKTNKKIIRVNQKFGETIVTEDHSIIAEDEDDLIQTRPQELGDRPLVRANAPPKVKLIKKIDLYEILKNYQYKSQYKGRTKHSVFHKDKNWLWFGWMLDKKPIKVKRFINVNSKDFVSLCRLLGAYIAEGSSSTVETTHRYGASIAGNGKWLRELQNDYHRLFKNSKTSIIQSTKKRRVLNYKLDSGKSRTAVYEDKTQKFQMMSEISAVFFKMLAGQKSIGKKLPDFVFHVPQKYQKILLEQMILGDGTREKSDRYSQKYREENFRYSTKSLHLVSGLSFLLSQLGQKYTIRYRKSKGEYRITTSSNYNNRINTKLESIKGYNGYVYDLSVDGTNMFVDSCGQILLHNTDSLMVSLKDERDIEKLKKIGQDFAEAANKKLPGIIELEFRGLYESGIFVTIKGTETGAKKRYALCDYDGRIEVKGFETVRRDWCELARRIQREVLAIVLKEKNPEKAMQLVKKTVKELKEGKVKLQDLSILEQITRPLAKYEQIGPHVKAAMKAQKKGRPIVEGTLMNYVITKGKGSISDRAEPVEDVKEGDYDPDYYIEHQIVPAAMRVMSALGREEGDLLGKKQFKLTHF